MKTIVIADNRDTYLGMRLAGIGGYYVEEPEKVEKSLEEAVKDPEVGVILITERCAGMVSESLMEQRKKSLFPLITVIPDRHGFRTGRSAITSYITDVIGVKTS